MKKQFGAGFIPYEPGDLVRLKGHNYIYKIEDIRMTQYIVSGTINFEVRLSNERLGDCGWWNPELIEERIINEK